MPVCEGGGVLPYKKGYWWQYEGNRTLSFCYITFLWTLSCVYFPEYSNKKTFGTFISLLWKAPFVGQFVQDNYLDHLWWIIPFMEQYEKRISLICVHLSKKCSFQCAHPYPCCMEMPCEPQWAADNSSFYGFLFSNKMYNKEPLFIDTFEMSVLSGNGGQLSFFSASTRNWT